jgi:hypothetical protein
MRHQLAQQTVIFFAQIHQPANRRSRIQTRAQCLRKNWQLHDQPALGFSSNPDGEVKVACQPLLTISMPSYPMSQYRPEAPLTS